MDEPLDPHLAADAGNGSRPPDVHVLEGVVTGLNAPSDQIDDNVGVLDGPTDRVLIFQFEWTEQNLTEVAHNLRERTKQG